MKIIIIDDEFFVLNSLKRNIHAYDDSIQVDVSSSVEEALTKLSINKYDCIVSDLNMPNQGGLALLKYLQLHKINIPLIIMTGCPKAESAVECMKTGAADFISKPFSAETLLEKVKEHTGGQKTWNEGYQLEEFSLKELISETSSSIVFTATDSNSDKKYAIKALKNEDLGISKTAYRRFEREIETLSKLDHPNIVKIIKCGLSEFGIPYIVMPFIEGKSLNQEIDELAENHFLDIMISLTETLDYIHSHDMVHRDIKPENIIISNGQPVLLDFGIILVKHDIQLTQEGVIIGTPNYMAPEAFNDSHTVDFKADLYSLGAILYRYIYKKCPYEGDDVYSIIKNIISYTDQQLYQDSEYDDLIKKLIDKEPSFRIESAQRLLEELYAAKQRLLV